MSKHIVARANVLVFAVLAIFIATIGVTTWDRLSSARSARDWVAHTYAVLDSIQDLEIAVRAAETDERGFLLTGRDSFIETYESALTRSTTLLSNIRRLTADNPAQQARLQVLEPAWQRRIQQFEQGIQARRDKGLEGVIAAMGPGVGRETMRAIEETLAVMNNEEESLLTQRLADSADRADWVGRLVVVFTVIALLALVWAARMLNRAYDRSFRAESDQRVLASRLNASLESLSQGVGVFGPGHLLRHRNDCFRALFDLPSSVVAIQTPYAEIAEKLVATTGIELERDDEIPRGPRPESEPIIYERAMKNGRLLEIRRTPTHEGGFVLTVTDMTRRSQAEAVLREAQKMQAIGQLTGGIAHDFNNLLTVILGNLELARGRMEPGHPLLGHIDRSLWAAQRGGTLTSQLLAFARKQPLAPAPVDLSATLPELVPLLRRTLGEHIDVRFVDSAGLWPALTDPAQLESAVLNLALNARDAMPGGGRLTIEIANQVLDDHYATSHNEVCAGDYVMIAVTDTGHGMTPEIAARVFEPFFTTKTEGRGTGLGLAMVFGFVKQSGGHIKIYSEPNEGTSVKIYLPRAIAAKGAVPIAVGLALAELPRGSATILIVEDEAGVREIAVAILSGLGYRVLEAADGEEGLRVFGANAAAVDMLLTDVVLPGKIRGRELAERIASMRPEVKVLYMSGYTENSIVHHGRLDDGVQLLGKPFKREHLARKVAQVLGIPDQPAQASNVVDLRRRDA